MVKIVASEKGYWDSESWLVLKRIIQKISFEKFNVRGINFEKFKTWGCIRSI
jgi:hypothetical protein